MRGCILICWHSLQPPRYRGKYKDVRTWRQRIETLDRNWKATLPALVDAYIQWKHTKPPTDAQGAVFLGPRFSIDIFDIYSLETTAEIPVLVDTANDAVALVSAGYLGTSPVKPTLAISLRTLELLRCVRLFKASFSMEGFAKLLCHYYKVCI